MVTAPDGRPSRLRAWPSTRRIVLQAIALLVAAVGLYIVWPSLAEVFKSWPSLRDIDPFWFLIMGAAEAGSFICLWLLLRLVLHTKDWYLISTSQLTSNAMSRIVPGGAATAGGLQFTMLTNAGVEGSRAATGVTAATAITTATLLAMPVLSLPAVLGGVSVPRGLERAALLGVGAFVLLAAIGALAFLWDLPLHWAGRLTQRLRNAVMRRRPRLTDLDERLVHERDALRAVLGSRYWEAVLTAVGKQLLDFVALLVALVAVGATPKPSLVLLAYVVSAILGMVPITPGGLGFVEAGLVATLQAAGVPSGQAVVATLAYRLWSYWVPLLVGPGAWILYRRRFGRPARLVGEAPELPEPLPARAESTCGE